MKRLALVLLVMLLAVPLVAKPRKTSNIKVYAFQYFDEYSRKWYLVEHLCVQQLTDEAICVEQSSSGEEMMEVYLSNLKIPGQYTVRVRWCNGQESNVTYTAYEAGEVLLWVDFPQ